MVSTCVGPVDPAAKLVVRRQSNAVTVSTELRPKGLTQVRSALHAKRDAVSGSRAFPALRGRGLRIVLGDGGRVQQGSIIQIAGDQQLRRGQGHAELDCQRLPASGTPSGPCAAVRGEHRRRHSSRYQGIRTQADFRAPARAVSTQRPQGTGCSSSARGATNGNKQVGPRFASRSVCCRWSLPRADDGPFSCPLGWLGC